MENSNSKQKGAKCEQCVNVGWGRPVHRKASRYSMCQDINLSYVPSVGHKTGSFFSPRIGRIGRIRYWRKEIKKFVAFPGLTPLQPGGDVHPCKQACLTEPPHPSGLPVADGKPQSKIAAVGNTKRLPWSHNDYPRLVRGSALHPLAYCP